MTLLGTMEHVAEVQCSGVSLSAFPAGRVAQTLNFLRDTLEVVSGYAGDVLVHAGANRTLLLVFLLITPRSPRQPGSVPPCPSSNHNAPNVVRLGAHNADNDFRL